MRTEKVEFEGALGDKLAGRLDSPDDDVKAYALFAHCFTCSKNLKVVGHITRMLTDEGIATLRFDFTGLGQSEGDFANTNFSSNIEDLLAAATYMKMHFESPQLLIGHSLGGAAVLQAAGRIDSVKAIATIGAPCETAHVKDNFNAYLDEIEETGKAVVQLAGRKFTIKKQFLEDIESTKMDEYIKHLNRALLVMHAPLDTTVGIDHAAHIYKLAKHPKSFVSLYGADHLLTDEKFSTYAGRIISSWSSLYIG